jgi:urease alpha subunit
MELIIEIEKDFTVYGDELTFGLGKVIAIKSINIPNKFSF